MKRAMVVAFVVATALGGYLAWHAGWPVVAIGVASIAAGVAYTGGPWPLGYHGLGDVFVMAFFGFAAVCGTAFVQLGTVPCVAVWAALPIVALATAILVVNNLRDRDGDARAGKRNARGEARPCRGALVEYAALLAVAYLVPLALAVTGRGWAALPGVTVPLAVMRLRALASAVCGGEYNLCLAATAQLLLVHGALFALGLAL